ncbi:hypothetical protein BT69DRAFT_294142 [Atractiella rhizophila]|nr:hypothetical protein BT69DRAFT_294142 [Atractiella rhizophila]
MFRGGSQNDPNIHINTLLALEKLLPKLVSTIPPPILSKALHHPDLSPANIVINNAEAVPKIAAVLDWQSTTIAPLFLQAKVPRHFDWQGSASGLVSLPDRLARPQKPENFDELDEELQKVVLREMWQARLHKVYLAFLSPYSQLRQGLFDEDACIFKGPFDLITGTWDQHSLLHLRRCLIQLSDVWPALFGNGAHVSFSEEERAVLEIESEEMDMIEGWESIASQLV